MGAKETIRLLSPERERMFPALAEIGYRVTSEETQDYNCIAWAFGDNSRKWDCCPGYFWPKGIQRDGSVDTLRKAFELDGYQTCTDVEHEPGFEKVVLYADDEMQWQHAAIQLKNGEWSSKLGGWEDIRHRNPYAVVCDDYGHVVYIMRRAIRELEHDEEEARDSAADDPQKSAGQPQANDC
jgi:hypothetical protein